MNENALLTVGSIAFDTVETPAGRAEKTLGGSANYFSLAASLFTPVELIAVVGDDFPENHLELLRSRRIGTRGIERQNGKTFHWIGAYQAENMNEAQTIDTALNVFEHFKPKLDENHRASNSVFLANIDPVLQLEVLNQLHNPKLIGLDSMNFWIRQKLSALRDVVSKVDIVFLNETEAMSLTNQRSLVNASQSLLEMGPRAVVIKRGEYGAALFTAYGSFTAPAFLLPEVKDPTGAGDSFAGAVMGTLHANGVTRDMLKSSPEAFDRICRLALLHGCTMASFTVQDFSFHRLQNLNREDFEARYNKLISMIRLP